jgi:UDP-N-acetylmuramoylalanine--D-glutamate ligase
VGAAILAQQKGYSVFVSDLGKIKEKYKNDSFRLKNRV